jgi:transposase InsO family protein
MSPAHVARWPIPSLLPARAKRDARLMPEIARVFEENFQVYGVRKVWRQLRREGQEVARCTVGRLMRTMGLEGVIRGKPVRTTISDKAAPCPLDPVNRQFQAPRPNALPGPRDLRISLPTAEARDPAAQYPLTNIGASTPWPRPSTASTRPR